MHFLLNRHHELTLISASTTHLDIEVSTLGLPAPAADDYTIHEDGGVNLFSIDVLIFIVSWIQ